MAIDVLLRAGRLLDEPSWSAMGQRALERLAPTGAKAPLAFGRLLAALDFELGRPIELAIIGGLDDGSAEPLIAVTRSKYLPNRLLAGANGPNGKQMPLLSDRQKIDGRPTAYLCEGFVCQAPTTDPTELARQLDEFTGS